MLSQIEGLKSISIKHLLFVGTNLTTDVANKSAAAFFALGIEEIFNARFFLNKS